MKKSTRKASLLFSLLVFHFSAIHASTTVPGGNIYGHWTLAGSPYNITGSVIVPNDSTLTIDPGVTVNFTTSKHLKMLVQGRLLAVGTASQNIYITASNQTTGFGGIRFDTLKLSNDTSKLIYCNIQYGTDGPAPYSNGGALHFNGWSKAVVSHCTIENCQATNGNGGAIYCVGSNINFTYNTISNCSTSSYPDGSGMYLANDTNIVISNNTIINNTATSGNGADAITLINVSNVAIINNNISGNEGVGITFSGGSLSYIYKNNITNNTTFYGGGIYLDGNIDSITNNTFTGNSTYGGIVCLGGIINIISHNTIENNTASYGGIEIAGGTTCNTISNNIITGNSGNAGNAGGGITIYGSVSIISNNTIKNNTGTWAGGISLNSGSNTTITNNTLSGNTGGGIFTYNCGTVIVSNNIITGNTSSYGGGIGLQSCTATISNNIITNNSSTIDGGGIDIYSNVTVNSISHNIITGNSSSYGGGICCNNGNNIITSIDNCLITNNSANATTGNGGGIYLDGNAGKNAPTITNVTIANNNAANGGGVFLINTANPVFTNCILYGDTADSAQGNEVFLYDQGSEPTFQYCDIYEGSAGFDLNGDFYTGTYSNNIGASPKFVSPSTGVGSGYNGTYNFREQATSPCRKAGDPGGTYPATDLAGDPRVVGGQIDIGAYEYVLSATCTTTPVLCSGGSTGTATCNAIDGVPAYTYSWSTTPIQTKQTATGLAAGTYTVTVTDASSTKATATVTVTQPTPITLSISRTDASCINGDGAATITPGGGTPPYNYAWSSGGTDSTASALYSGTYTITVTDSNSCTAIDTVNLRINPYVSKSTAEICVVSVDTDSKYNVIVWNKTGLVRIDSFKVYYLNSSSSWQLLKSIPFSEPDYFVDSSSINNPNSNTVRYCLTTIDSCGNEEPIPSSPWQNTMYINQAPAGTFTWSGTGYLKQGVSLPVITYYLYRDSLSNGNWVPIDSISGTQNKMSDAAYQANPGGYDFARWRVEALLSDSVNTGCTLPDLRPVHGMNNTTTRSNTQHNSIFTSASTLATALPSISVFPNPTNGIFQLKITNYESGIRNVDILNILGQKVYSVENYQITKSSNYQIDLSNQPAGVYFVKVLTDKSVQVVKLIKE